MVGTRESSKAKANNATADDGTNEKSQDRRSMTRSKRSPSTPDKSKAAIAEDGNEESQELHVRPRSKSPYKKSKIPKTKSSDELTAIAADGNKESQELHVGLQPKSAYKKSKTPKKKSSDELTSAKANADGVNEASASVNDAFCTYSSTDKSKMTQPALENSNVEMTNVATGEASEESQQPPDVQMEPGETVLDINADEEPITKKSKTDEPALNGPLAPGDARSPKEGTDADVSKESITKKSKTNQPALDGLLASDDARSPNEGTDAVSEEPITNEPALDGAVALDDGRSLNEGTDADANVDPITKKPKTNEPVLGGTEEPAISGGVVEKSNGNKVCVFI